MYSIDQPIALNQARVLKTSPLTLETWPQGWVYSFCFLPDKSRFVSKKDNYISVTLKFQVLTGKVGIGIVKEDDEDCFLKEIIVSETNDSRTLELLVKKEDKPGKLIIRSAGHFQVSVVQIFTISATEKFIKENRREPAVRHIPSETTFFEKKPKNPIVIAAILKSGSTFISKSIEKTLNLEPRFVLDDGYTIRPNLFYDAVTRFTETIVRDHIDPTPYNVKMMQIMGVKKLVLLLRDPRDTIVSFAHHLASDAFVGDKMTQFAFIARGFMTEDYYQKSFSEQLDVLIDHYYPWVESWCKSWFEIYQAKKEFNMLLVKYEDFCQNNAAEIQKILKFYECDMSIDSIQVPEKKFYNTNGICEDTRFRKGIAGSHKQELSSDQINKLNVMRDKDFYEKVGWVE